MWPQPDRKQKITTPGLAVGDEQDCESEKCAAWERLDFPGSLRTPMCGLSAPAGDIRVPWVPPTPASPWSTQTCSMPNLAIGMLPCCPQAQTSALLLKGFIPGRLSQAPKGQETQGGQASFSGVLEEQKCVYCLC